ncbi:hypothetical protein [Clostridium perfringens]|uniref:hypothetical protein n=1 Tax=Clostridium perfringens TaxID=1502 RepID=UPI0024BC7950|nr:hypothetical protein [Clostridium perfringens]
MNPQAIIELLDHALIELINLNENLTILAEQKALTEGRYRRELRKEILLLRQEKVQVTLIDNLVKGKEDISTLRYKRDIAASKYFTCISAIENKRLEIEVLRSKLTWLRVEYKNS